LWLLAGLDDPDLHTPRDDMGLLTPGGSARACPECMDMEQVWAISCRSNSSVRRWLLLLI